MANQIEFGIRRRVPNQVAVVLVLIIGLAISIFTIKAGEKIVSGFSEEAAKKKIKSYDPANNDLLNEIIIPTKTLTNPTSNQKVK